MEVKIYNMADNVNALQAQLQAAAGKGDWKQVIEIGSQLKRAQSEADKARAEANKGKVIELSIKVKGELIKVAKRFEEAIVALVGEDKARVKFEYDFSNELDSTIAITKSTGGSKRVAGSGSPQRYEKSTNDLLSAFGGQQFLKNGQPSGQTLKEAYDSNTDGNWRFKVRQQLIKLDTK